MSNSVAPAVKTANDEIPWNPKVRQKKQPADYVVDFLIGLLVDFTDFVCDQSCDEADAEF